MLRLPLPTCVDPVRVPLAFAALVAGRISAPEWHCYLASLDPADLPADVLPDLPHAFMRPLSVADRDAAELEAGPPSQLAAVVRRRLYEATADRPAEEQAQAIDALPEGERRALQAESLREDRLRVARLRRALVRIEDEDGDPVARLLGVDEGTSRLAVVELGAVLARISELSPEGKARAGRQ